MFTNILRAILVIDAVYFSGPLAAEPKFIDPDSTNFKFSFGKSPLCNLAISAIKVPITLLLDVQAQPRLHNPLITYEVHARSGEGPSIVKDARISSDTFVSEGFVRRASANASRYIVNDAATGQFTDMIARGWFYLNVKFGDGRTLAYVIRADEKLSEVESNMVEIKHWGTCWPPLVFIAPLRR
jgi:hypothetical protein